MYFPLFSIIATEDNADKKLYLQLFQARFPAVFHHAQMGHPIAGFIANCEEQLCHH